MSLVIRAGSGGGAHLLLEVAVPEEEREDAKGDDEELRVGRDVGDVDDAPDADRPAGGGGGGGARGRGWMGLSVEKKHTTVS